ncbi:choice-of-anchor Q domain-containing protein [Desulfosarcina variabilis]|uniref:choice-of-anchor Q domain-containing protein n=1 Tax=Desulfosarcina variabilis TaxID=2300 RepID=UPI003AFAE5BF
MRSATPSGVQILGGNNDLPCYHAYRFSCIPAFESPSLGNNICSQNTISQIDANSSSIDSVYLDHNLIDGDSVDYGTDYVSGSPDFLDATGGDFHLNENSKAIDSGTPVDAPLVDFDETIRPIGIGFDIGAFEYAESCQ